MEDDSDENVEGDDIQMLKIKMTMKLTTILQVEIIDDVVKNRSTNLVEVLILQKQEVFIVSTSPRFLNPIIPRSKGHWMSNDNIMIH